MKRLFFIAIAALCFASCSQPTVQKDDSLPIEVVTIKEAQAFDTVLTVETDRKVYQFTKTGEFVGSYHKTNAEDGMAIFSLVLLCLLCVGLVISLD